MKNKCQCKNCQNRYPGCHSKCESYLAFKKERDEMHQEYLKNKKIDNYRYLNK